MEGSKSNIFNFLEGADKRYIIPVYQRKYAWNLENCRRLYSDLKKIILDNRSSHFFGSIVSSVVPKGSKFEFHIIDGQQRLTTITLLLLALRNLIRKNKIVPTKEKKLDEQISQRFLISPWASDDDKIKLRPVKSDVDALRKLFDDEEISYDASNMTLNYRFFCEQLLKKEVSPDDLFNAINKLEIISITLDANDNAQLIFESLNSTGLALREGDKIRNYVLMGQSPQEQTRLYNSHWTKIEQSTSYDVSEFVRDYLSIKQQITPNISNVYNAFKNYAESVNLPVDALLVDMKKYAQFFETLHTCNTGNQKLDACLYRLKRLEIVVTRPFFMEILRLNHDGKISDDDTAQIFLITENYLFRRNICEAPTNALNKIFLNLNREILRYDNSAENYVKKFIYALLSKKESGRFPNDEEFSKELSEKQVYLMRGKYKAYMFERFENFGTIETKDVYSHLDKNEYTIEHIMPQHLSPAWNDALGENASEIHSTWLHRLANLTLTGYNSSLNNKTFPEKRDAQNGGYKISGLRINQKISQKESWGLSELQERNDEMIKRAKEIWEFPNSDFVPAEKEFDSCILDDEDIDLTGREIVKYSYQNTEQPVNTWADMFENVIKFLHGKETSILYNIFNTELSCYFSKTGENLRSPLKIDENLFVERNTSTALKISILRRLFTLYDADPMNLVFFLKDEAKENTSENIRKSYWTYALPIIKKANEQRGTFQYCSPTTSNATKSSLGKGISISCNANYDGAIIFFTLAKNDKAENKKLFDFLFSHKNEIESALDFSLDWKRADNCMSSWLSYSLSGVSVANQSDWPRMAEFHAKYSEKICSVIIPYLQNFE